MQTATHTLADLVDLVRLQRTCDSFAAIGDIVLAVLDLDGTVLVSAGWQDICTRFHRIHKDTAQACRESDRQIDRRLVDGLHGQGAPEHYAYRCANGLWDVAFPLVIAGKHLGNVFTGQFFYDDDEIDVAAFRARARRLGFDEAAYLEALARVPVLSHERVAQTISFLADFVGMLGELGLSALRKEEESAALRESEAKYHDVVERANDGIAILQGGLLVFANEALGHILGYSVGELTGLPFLTLVREDQRAPVAERVRRRLAGEELSATYEIDLVRKDAAPSTAEASGGAITYKGAPADLVLIRDVSERKRLEEALRRSEAEYRRIVETALEGIIVLDSDARMTLVNQQMATRLGYAVEEMVGRPFEGFLAEDQLADHQAQMTIRARGEDAVYERCFRCKDGGTSWALISAKAIIDPAGRREGSFATLTDITARKQVEDELRETRDYLENLLGHANAPIIVWDAEQRITRFNHAFEELTGRTAGEVVGEHLELLFPEDERRAQTLELVTRASAGERWQVVEIPILREGGEVRTVLWNSATLFADDGVTPVATIAQGQDISARKRAEEALARLNDELLAETAALAEANATITRIAATDELTGLANRRHFYESLERAISLARRHGSPVALVALDLDGLKRVNDSAGHEAGDEVLASFAALLAALCRAEDVPARIGGDEFSVLLPGIERGGARGFAERVRAAVRSCEALAQRGVTVSAGVVQWSPDDLSDDLLRRADEALYAAKRGGGDAVAGDAAATAGHG